MQKRNQIVEEARSYLGVRWRHQGRSRTGIDCAGLIIIVGNSLELMNFDFRAYRRHPDGVVFLKLFREQAKEEIAPQKAVAGDILVFHDHKYPVHCGILTKDTEPRYFIHAYARYRKVVEEHFSKDWQQKVVSAFIYPGVD